MCIQCVLDLHSISGDSNDKEYGGRVGVQNSVITTLLLLYTNMEAMTSHAKSRIACLLSQKYLSHAT